MGAESRANNPLPLIAGHAPEASTGDFLDGLMITVEHEFNKQLALADESAKPNTQLKLFPELEIKPETEAK